METQLDRIEAKLDAMLSMLSALEHRRPPMLNAEQRKQQASIAAQTRWDKQRANGHASQPNAVKPCRPAAPQTAAQAASTTDAPPPAGNPFAARSARLALPMRDVQAITLAGSLSPARGLYPPF